MNMAASILRYELNEKARTRPEIFRLVLGPCKDLGQKPKTIPKEITLSIQFFSKKQAIKKNSKSDKK